MQKKVTSGSLVKSQLPPRHPWSVLPEAGVLHSLRRRYVHVGRDWLVHESAESHAQVAGGLVDGFGEVVAQHPQAAQVVVHGVGEVHQVVQIYRVVLHLSHLHREALGIAYRKIMYTGPF